MKDTGPLRQVAENAFDGNALLILLALMAIALVLGKILSSVLRRLSRMVGKRADASVELGRANRLRRVETWMILSIAIVRTICIIVGLYFWWVITHPHEQPTALFGASAVLVVVIGGVFSPLLRDFAFGSGMMAEHWFGVGDLVTIEPFNLQGVVERITLRSTRLRGLNGEVIWVANQNIGSVRIAQKGVWPIALEMFVSDLPKAQKLIERANTLLPTGPALVASRLVITNVDKRSDDVWHVTVVGETAPGREWLLENTALALLKKLDGDAKNTVLITDPVARYADNDTERQFARAVTNAKKTRRAPRKRKVAKSDADHYAVNK